MRLATNPQCGSTDARVSDADPLPPTDRPIASRCGILETLYRQNAPRLRGFFARRTNADDANDLVHETFVRFAGLDALTTNIAKPEAYLGTVATNLLRDRARQAARRSLEFHESLVEDEVVGTDPHSMLEDRDTLARLELAVQRLNSRRRRIFLLHRLDHLTYAEIAVETGMSVKGVKTQMAKALFELRRELGPF